MDLQAIAGEDDKSHARLITVKNAAYAWRQMVFYLALLPKRDVCSFLESAGEYLDGQSEDFKARFRPALGGLIRAVGGESVDDQAASPRRARRFLGWSKERHWLLASR